MISEKEFQRTVIEYAHALKYKVYHQVDMGHRDPESAVQRYSRRIGPGYPDLTIVGRGKILFVELKSEKGKRTSDQELWANEITKAGGEYHLWRPSDWETIEEILQTWND